MSVRNVRSVMVLLIAGSLAIGLPAGPAGAAGAAIPKERSGLRWASGTFNPEQSRSVYNAFGVWRKAKNDVALTFPGRSTWAEIENPSWLYEDWKGSAQTLVLSLAPFPDQSKYSLAACAKGAYDRHWRRFGTEIRKVRMAKRTVVRLGWEFNGSWVPWAAYDPDDFVQCWRHVYRAAESKAPRLRWDWTVNRGDGDALVDAREAWPGKKYVDIVGVDSYDGWPPAVDAEGWDAQYAVVYGLKFWADFARSKGKRLSVPEWGLMAGTSWAGHNGGDNPYYIRKMFWFFGRQQDNLAYEAYFNDEDPAHLSALSLNPKGAAEYRRQIVKARVPRKK